MGNSTDGLQAVLFGASGSAYGADIHDVREIMKLSSITAIPGASTHTEGVIDVRGEVVPLLSLRSLTGAPRCEHDKETRVLILDCRPPIGLIVDTVSEVKSIPSAAIEPMPSIAIGAGEDSFYKGIAKLSDRMIIIMDLKKISTIAGGKTAECEQTSVVAPVGATTMGPADNAMISSDSSLELTEFRIDALRVAWQHRHVSRCHFALPAGRARYPDHSPGHICRAHR
jgi:Chemotaxis signal transduction protein